MKYKLKQENGYFLIIHIEENRQVIWMDGNHCNYELATRMLNRFNEEK